MFYVSDDEDFIFSPDVDDPDFQRPSFPEKNNMKKPSTDVRHQGSDSSLVTSMETLRIRKAYSWHHHLYLYGRDEYLDEFLHPHYEYESENEEEWRDEEEAELHSCFFDDEQDVHNVSSDSLGLITIETLRDRLGSCFSCGVRWTDDHVTLDCKECGGYATERPCPKCEGDCMAVWQRDTSVSHSLGKASWIGQCRQESKPCESS